MSVVKLFFKLARCRRGQAMTEYGLIIAIIAVVLIGVLIALREQIASLFNSIIEALKLSG